MNDWVRSGLPDPRLRYWKALVKAMIAAAPNKSKAANALNTHWIRDDQLRRDLIGWFVTGELDIIKTVFPGTGWKFKLLGRKRSFLLDSYTNDLIARGKIGALGRITGGETGSHIHTLDYFTEDGVFSIQRGLGRKGDEELAAI